MYIHSLPRQQEEIINNMLRTYKRQYLLNAGLLIPESGEIVKPIQLEFDLDAADEDVYIIPVYDGNKEEVLSKKGYDRTKAKKEARRLILLDEEESFEYDDEYWEDEDYFAEEDGYDR